MIPGVPRSANKNIRFDQIYPACLTGTHPCRRLETTDETWKCSTSFKIHHSGYTRVSWNRRIVTLWPYERMSCAVVTLFEYTLLIRKKWAQQHHDQQPDSGNVKFFHGPSTAAIIIVHRRAMRATCPLLRQTEKERDNGQHQQGFNQGRNLHIRFSITYKRTSVWLHRGQEAGDRRRGGTRVVSIKPLANPSASSHPSRYFFEPFMTYRRLEPSASG